MSTMVQRVQFLCVVFDLLSKLVTNLCLIKPGTSVPGFMIHRCNYLVTVTGASTAGAVAAGA